MMYQLLKRVKSKAGGCHQELEIGREKECAMAGTGDRKWITPQVDGGGTTNAEKPLGKSGSWQQ